MRRKRCDCPFVLVIGAITGLSAAAGVAAPHGTPLVFPGASSVSVRFSPCGRWFAGVGNGEVRVWQAAAPRTAVTLAIEGRYLSAAEFCPGGVRLATRDHAGAVQLWDGCPGWEGASWRELVSAAKHEAPGVTVLADGRRIPNFGGPSAGEPGELDARVLAFSSDATLLATVRRHARRDNDLAVVEVESGRIVRSFAPEGGVRCIHTAPEAGLLVMTRWRTTREHAVLVLDFPSLEPRGHVPIPGGPNVFAWLSPDGRLVAATRYQPAQRRKPAHTVLYLRDLETRRWLMQEEYAPGLGVAFSWDGSLLAVGSQQQHGPGIVSVRDIKSGRGLTLTVPGARQVRSIAFCPDTRRLGVGVLSEENPVYLWDLQPEPRQWRSGSTIPRAELLP